jgi:hypothetical protein
MTRRVVRLCLVIGGARDAMLRGKSMLKKLLGLVAAAYLLGACASEPPPPPPPPAAPPPPQAFMVFFDWDSTRLSPASLNVLEQARDAFKARQGARVTATGHTDTTGTEAYNMALSLRRANAVKDALVKLGVPAAAITTVGRGEAGLLVQTGDGVREPQNRRVEITLPPQMAAAPPTNDQAYCAQLARLWRNYDRTTAQGPGPQAIAKCDAGDYASGIPVLERLLTDARIPLPPRA